MMSSVSCCCGVTSRAVFEQTRKAEHGVERGAQLVAHVGEKHALGAIGHFGASLGFGEFSFALLRPGDINERAGHQLCVPTFVSFGYFRARIEPFQGAVRHRQRMDRAKILILAGNAAIEFLKRLLNDRRVCGGCGGGIGQLFCPEAELVSLLSGRVRREADHPRRIVQGVAGVIFPEVNPPGADLAGFERAIDKLVEQI